MKLTQRTFATLSMLAALLVQPTVFAGTLTIDFEDGPYGTTGNPYGPNSGTNNFLSKHFSFSPGCHFDWTNTTGGIGAPPGGQAPFGHWLGFDTSGCGDSLGSIGYNKNYLGPTGPAPQTSTLFVQQEFGALFSLESFVFATIDYTSGAVEVRSSKGGTFLTGYSDGVFINHNFSGSAWADVSWLEFKSIAPGAPVGIDNLVLQSESIPEPSTLALLLSATFGLVATRLVRIR